MFVRDLADPINVWCLLWKYTIGSQNSFTGLIKSGRLFAGYQRALRQKHDGWLLIHHEKHTFHLRVDLQSLPTHRHPGPHF